jgi:SAM-dependent methyltransferase
MDDRIAANARMWDEWARINQGSELYAMAAFRAGQTSLKPIELEQVGSVAGKSLLHLQCHFGQDTLSWARSGARVTGVDLSSEAIRRAQALAAELKIDARFICSDVLELTALGRELFDIVFVSYGALIWLPDVDRWAQTIARHLKPGGMFHLVEFHPMVMMLDDDAKSITTSYFGGDALTYQATSSYAGGGHDPLPGYEWQHTLGDVVSALLKAGLALSSFREFPYCVHNCWPFLVESAPGQFVVKHHPGKLPLLYSIAAQKPA